MNVLRILILVPVSTICVTAYTISLNNAGFRRQIACMKMGTDKSIYGISKSGCKSPQWNWGSAVGTGHDCAKICRQNYSNRILRQDLISNLINAQGTEEDKPSDFEEVKLVLALAWQRGRWDGSDGGTGGYGEVLENLVVADRYENGTELQWSKLWIRDLASRFHLLNPSTDNVATMEYLVQESEVPTEDEHEEYSVVCRCRRRCSGLVLLEMGFINNGC